MEPSLQEILQSYNENSALKQAYTIPASWYVDERIAALERQYVFGGTWQVVAGVEQLKRAGQFVTRELAGEPIVVVRASDGELQAFYNVCRHHAAAVVSAPEPIPDSRMRAPGNTSASTRIGPMSFG